MSWVKLSYLALNFLSTDRTSVSEVLNSPYDQAALHWLCSNDKLDQLLYWILEFCIVPLWKKIKKRCKSILVETFVTCERLQKYHLDNPDYLLRLLILLMYSGGPEKNKQYLRQCNHKNLFTCWKMWCHDIRETLVCHYIFLS